jgi:hypothetical protein
LGQPGQEIPESDTHLCEILSAGLA